MKKVKNVYILCQNYLDFQLDNFSIGGIETYLQNLCKIFLEEEITPIIIQYANTNKAVVIDGVKIIGVDITGARRSSKINNRLYKVFCNENIKNPGILLYATEGLITSKLSSEIYSMAIQHGISWDKPDYSKDSILKYEAYYWKRALINRLVLSRVEKVDRMVCVDYNYINWYRAQVAYSKVRLDAIPNFTEIPIEKKVVNPNVIKIIFARRFFEYRGTRIFAYAIKRILSEYDKVDVTLAGTGPDEQWLKRELPESSNVHYIKYGGSESLYIHRNKDIAVIPTVGSEGTSLSLLEAMASKCAPICSNVGGMTNIVIDGYNGLMVNPDTESLYNALKKIIDDAELREKLSSCAYQTAKDAFSFEEWKARWKRIVREVFYE